MRRVCRSDLTVSIPGGRSCMPGLGSPAGRSPGLSRPGWPATSWRGSEADNEKWSLCNHTKYFVLTFLNLANITKAVVFPMTPRRPVTAAHTHMIVSSGRGGEMFRDGEDVIFISRNTVLIMSFMMTPYSQPKYKNIVLITWTNMPEICWCITGGNDFKLVYKRYHSLVHSMVCHGNPLYTWKMKIVLLWSSDLARMQYFSRIPSVCPKRSGQMGKTSMMHLSMDMKIPTRIDDSCNFH